MHLQIAIHQGSLLFACTAAMGNAAACCSDSKTNEPSIAELPAIPAFPQEFTFGMGEEPPLPSHLILDGTDGCLVDNNVDNNDEAIDIAKSDDKIGDHVCPVVGEAAVDSFFTSEKLNQLFIASKEDLGRNFNLGDDIIKGTMKVGSIEGFSCAIADPMTRDCPLVFLSSGFQNMTGYPSSVASGRNCRFLQPISKTINDAFNLDERKVMREFCTTLKPVGATLVNLLLNERNSGERYWNLLRMQYLEVDGQLFILAVQSVLHCFMPKSLARRSKDDSKNKRICEQLESYISALGGIRAEIKEKASASVPITELRGYYTCAMDYLRMLPILSKMKPSLQKSLSGSSNKTSLAPVLKAGMTVQAIQDISYPVAPIVKDAVGEVISIDAFGNASVKWQGDGGSGSILKRDYNKLKILSQCVLNTET